MKLHWSPRSPFVRKVMIAAHELGVADRITCVRSPVAQTRPNEAVMRDSPLGKIPCLVLDDGTAIFDSPVICEYLDLTCGPGRLVPQAAPARIEALTRQALGDGLLDLLLAWRNELNREPGLQSAPHLASYELRVGATLDRLDLQAAGWDGTRFDIGDITTGCALSYLDFRFPSLDWRAGRATLDAWHRGFQCRPSVVAVPILDEAAAA